MSSTSAVDFKLFAAVSSPLDRAKKTTHSEAPAPMLEFVWYAKIIAAMCHPDSLTSARYPAAVLSIFVWKDSCRIRDNVAIIWLGACGCMCHNAQVVMAYHMITH